MKKNKGFHIHRKCTLPAECPCGVDPYYYPHDLRICSPHLARRLQKMAYYLEQLPRPYDGFRWNLSRPVHNQTRGLTTAFPNDPHTTNCAMCGFACIYDWPLRLVSKKQFVVDICTTCRRKGGSKHMFSFCFHHMREGLDVCVRPCSRMALLCLKRLGLPKELALLIVKRYVFADPRKCNHDQ